MKVSPSERFHSASDLAAALGGVSPALNWVTVSLGAGAYQWRAVRPPCADLEVNLLQGGLSTWRTEVWTDKSGERRRRGMSKYWAKQLSYQDACEHLTGVFADLGQ
jgi:hypothetical protein